MKCEKCGAECDVLDEVCKECGASLTESNKAVTNETEKIYTEGEVKKINSGEDSAENESESVDSEDDGSEKNYSDEDFFEDETAENADNENEEDEEKKSNSLGLIIALVLILLLAAASIAIFIFLKPSNFLDGNWKVSEDSYFAFEGNSLKEVYQDSVQGEYEVVYKSKKEIVLKKYYEDEQLTVEIGLRPEINEVEGTLKLYTLYQNQVYDKDNENAPLEAEKTKDDLSAALKATTTTEGTTQEITSPTYETKMSEKVKKSIQGKWSETVEETDEDGNKTKVTNVYEINGDKAVFTMGEDKMDLEVIYVSDSEVVFKMPGDSAETEFYMAYKPSVKDNKLTMKSLYNIYYGQKMEAGEDAESIVATKVTSDKSK